MLQRTPPFKKVQLLVPTWSPAPLCARSGAQPVAVSHKSFRHRRPAELSPHGEYIREEAEWYWSWWRRDDFIILSRSDVDTKPWILQSNCEVWVWNPVLSKSNCEHVVPTSLAQRWLCLTVPCSIANSAVSIGFSISTVAFSVGVASSATGSNFIEIDFSLSTLTTSFSSSPVPLLY